MAAPQSHSLEEFIYPTANLGGEEEEEGKKAAKKIKNCSSS